MATGRKSPDGTPVILIMVTPVELVVVVVPFSCEFGASVALFGPGGVTLGAGVMLYPGR